jgi:hypothetical protein
LCIYYKSKDRSKIWIFKHNEFEDKKDENHHVYCEGRKYRHLWLLSWWGLTRLDRSLVRFTEKTQPSLCSATSATLNRGKIFAANIFVVREARASNGIRLQLNAVKISRQGTKKKACCWPAGSLPVKENYSLATHNRAGGPTGHVLATKKKLALKAMFSTSNPDAYFSPAFRPRVRQQVLAHYPVIPRWLTRDCVQGNNALD